MKTLVTAAVVFGVGYLIYKQIQKSNAALAAQAKAAADEALKATEAAATKVQTYIGQSSDGWGSGAI